MNTPQTKTLLQRIREESSLTLRALIYAMAALLFTSQVVQAAESVTYYHNDALGSPVAATDASGKVVWREHYQPYGSRILHQGDATNDMWYTGKPEEAALGLQYFGARWYDPTLGRFTGIDPKGFDPSNIQSFNRYKYANNNPYKYVDPNGKFEEIIFIGVVGTLGYLALSAAVNQNSQNAAHNNSESNGGSSSSGSNDLSGLTATPPPEGPDDEDKFNVRLENPNNIRYSQNNMRRTFSDGRSVDDMIKGLRDGSITADDVPAIRTVVRNGQRISIDNRRLYAFRKAGVSIRTRPATTSEIEQAIKKKKFSAGPSGSDTIRIRGSND